LFADRLSIDRPVSTGISIGGTLSLGLVKEFFDRRSRERHFSWKDLAFDAAGTTLGYLVFIHNY
jgi:uncharacterized protein YfiM (DUF2279 family)